MISYAGQPLLAPDQSVIDWVKSHLDPAWIFCEAAVRTWPGRDLDVIGFRGYIPKGPVEIGKLVWPASRASHWAYAHFLVDEDTLKSIGNVVYQGSSYQPADLVINDGTDSLTTSMYMLPARPLAKAEGSPSGLWLLTLVDVRFHWWFRGGVLSVTDGVLEDFTDEDGDDILLEQGATTWEELYEAIADLLGITITVDDVDADYLSPPESFSLTYHALPLILDAVAYCVGQRVCRRLDGTVVALNVTSSQTEFASNLLIPASTDRLAGGELRLVPTKPPHDLPTILPDSVTVVFPLIINDLPQASGYAYVITLASLSLSDLPANTPTFTGTKVFKSSAVASATTVGGTPTNNTELQALAEQIATDWYRYQVARLDVRYEGVIEWIMEGLTEAVEYEHVFDRISTRVYRGPYLDHIEDLFHLGTFGSVEHIYVQQNFWFVGGSINLQNITNIYWPLGWQRQCEEFERIRCLADGYFWRYAWTSCLELTPEGLIRTSSPVTRVGTEGCCDCPEPSSVLCVPGTCVDCGDPPYAWNITPVGFTGSAAVFNRPWYLVQDDPPVACTWYATATLNGETATVTLVIATTTVTVTFEYAGTTSTYTGTIVATECCDEVELNLETCGFEDAPSAEECTLCEGAGGLTPATWRGTISGATGCFSDLNRSFTVPQNSVGDCVWTLSDTQLYVVSIGGVGKELWFSAFEAAGGLAQYRSYATVEDQCCSPVEVFLWDADCSPTTDPGSVPTSIVLHPSCSVTTSGCPDNLTAIPECCTDTLGGGGGGGGGGTVETDCCPDNPLPTTLYLHLTGATGTCACMEDTYTLTWNGFSWTAVPTVCTSSAPTVLLSCRPDGKFTLGFTTATPPHCSFSSLSISEPEPSACDPLEIDFGVATITAGCCVGTVTAVVNETP